MCLIWKNRSFGMIVLAIYLNAIFEFIFPTNGQAVGDLTQPHTQLTRLEHLLLSGTYFSNKAGSPLIKSIVPDGPNSKEPYAYRTDGLQGKVINEVATPEYGRDKRKQSNNTALKITKPWNGLSDQDSFRWDGRHVQNKLLFAVLSSHGAHINDPSFSYLNQEQLDHGSSVDISHIVSNNDGGKTIVSKDKTLNGQSLISNYYKHNAFGERYSNEFNKDSLNSQRFISNSSNILKSYSIPSDKVDFHRYRRGSDAAGHHLKEITDIQTGLSRTRLPTGADIYYKLVDYIKQYSNMSTDEGNFTTYTVPWVIELHCPDVIDELYRTVSVPDDGELYCNSSWDEYSCWPRTLAGTFAVIPCPGYLPGIDETDNATKYCHENGTWADKAKYENCLGENEAVHEEDINKRAVLYIYHVGFSISTLTLLIALFIFLYFRSLRCLRNSIHCHLIVSFIFMNIMWIIMRHTLIPLHSSPHVWLMKFEVGLFNYSQGTNFFWMFVEGLYLHIIIVWTYSADKIKLRYLFVIGWILPAVFTIAWIVVMQTQPSSSSWLPESLGDNGSSYEYIYITPILVVLFANIIFLSTIVWVLITKLRASHTLETRQYRKAVKATVILFPLLGITYVLFIVPPSNDPQVHVIFNYINAVLQSLQGFFVAVFYCFLNGEVKGVLKKRVLRFNDARALSTKYTKTSVAWTRASRDYTSTVSFGNGAVSNHNRRFNGQQSHAEQIPLKTKEEYETETDECT